MWDRSWTTRNKETPKKIINSKNCRVKEIWTILPVGYSRANDKSQNKTNYWFAFSISDREIYSRINMDKIQKTNSKNN